MALKLICEEFYQTVHDHLSQEDLDLLFNIARVSNPFICVCVCVCMYVCEGWEGPDPRGVGSRGEWCGCVILLLPNTQDLQPVHQTLLEGFEKCVESKSGNTDITKYFLDSQQGLLMYGLYAARLPMAVEKV